MMNVRFRIGLINASLPSYFPRRHGVFEAAEKMLADLTADLGIGHSIPVGDGGRDRCQEA